MWVELARLRGYLIGDDGTIVSMRFGRWREMQPIYTNGYATLRLYGKRYKVHRLVMEAFYGPSNLQVNHLNYARDDNRLENLEYCTPTQNMRHASNRPGRRYAILQGERNGRSKLSDRERIAIQELRGRLPVVDIARLFNISEAQTYLICSLPFSE